MLVYILNITGWPMYSILTRSIFFGADLSPPEKARRENYEEQLDERNFSNIGALYPSHRSR